MSILTRILTYGVGLGLAASALAQTTPVVNLHVRGQSQFDGPVNFTSPISSDQPIPVSSGGTGSNSPAGAQAALGLGAMATQDSGAVNIGGGAINGTSVGSATPASGTFTTLTATGSAAIPNLQYQSTGTGSISRTVSKKLTENLSVYDFGAVGDGVADETAAFSKTAKAVIGGNSQAIGRPAIPSPNWAQVYVPAGNFVLTSYVDTGNKEVNWLLDPGAVITGVQYLNGRVTRLGSKTTDMHYGITDGATTLGIMANQSQDAQAKVSGYTSPSQLSAGNGRDSVSLYVDNREPTALYGTASVVSYSATGATLSTPLTTDQQNQMRTSMVVVTRHTPQAYAGMVTGWTATSITVSAWYLIDGSANGTATTPTGTVGLDINAFRKAWAMNANVFIDPLSYGNAVNTLELGLQNTKANPQSLGGPIEANGLYMTNLGGAGSYYGDAAYIADGLWTWGYKVNGGITTAFYYDGSTNPQGTALSSLLYGMNASKVPFYQIKPDGSVEMGPRGSANTTALDFHSGAVDTDYDARLVSTGGSGSPGGGTATLIASTILLQGSTSIDTYAVLRPHTDNTMGLGQPDHRWSSVNGVTANFTNGTFGAVTVSNDITVNGKMNGQLVHLAPYTVATLPTCNVSLQDLVGTVSDANAPAWNSTLTGGGSVRTLAYCNGTNWVAH